MIINHYTYIIIVVYNESRHTIECLKSIFNLESKDYKLIIVDNGSTENSLTVILNWLELNEKFYENINIDLYDDFKKANNISIIKNDTNKGYSFGNNVGINFAIKHSDCKYLWILNNDTILYSDSLKHLLLSDQKEKKSTMWGSKILNEDKTVQSIGCNLNKYFMSTYHIYNGKNNSDDSMLIKDFDYLHGCSLFFKKNIINEIGLMPEEYFLFYEDVAFCKEARKNNISLKICEKSVVIHKENISIQKSGFEYLSVVNRIKFGMNYYPDKKFYIYLGVLFELLKSLFKLQFFKFKMIVDHLTK